MQTPSASGAASEALRPAEAARAACIEAAIAAYERARTDGLCEAGAWECAIEVMRGLDLVAALQQAPRTR